MAVLVSTLHLLESADHLACLVMPDVCKVSGLTRATVLSQWHIMQSACLLGSVHVATVKSVAMTVLTVTLNGR